MKIKSQRRTSEHSFEVKIDNDFSFFIKRADSAYEAAKTMRLLKLTGYTNKAEFLADKRGIDKSELAEEFELFQRAEVKAERMATIDELITGWNAVNEEDGEPVEFSKQNVINFILNDKDLAHIIDEATLAAFNESNFWSRKASEAAEQIKKS